MNNGDEPKKWTHHDVKRGDADAMNWLRQDAEQGNPDAQYRLGMCYLKGHGHGIRREKEKAVHWFHEAAVLGHADAQYQLGDCFLCARGVDQNDGEAAKWFSKAAEQGNKDATQKLPALLQRINEEAAIRKAVQERWTKAIKKFREAAQKGNAEAQYQLGLIYSGESDMLRKEVFGEYTTLREKTGTWFIALIRRFFRFTRTLFRADFKVEGNSSYVLPYKYRGISRYDYVEYREAAKWFLKAAEQGHTEAQRIIAKYYFYGTGVPQNSTEAMKWLRKANRLLKRSELVERLKALAENKPPYDIVAETGAMCYCPALPVEIKCPECNRTMVVGINDRILDNYNYLIARIQHYGLDATLIMPEYCCSYCGSGLGGDVLLEINYPDRPDPVRVKLKSSCDLGLMVRFLGGNDRYRGWQDDEYPLAGKIARLAELFGVELPSNAEMDMSRRTEG